MKFFGYYRNGAVVQRGEPVLVKGYADGEVVCTLRGGAYKEVKTVKSNNGKFAVEFSPVNDCKAEYTLSASDGKEEISIKIYFGDVYLTMGQSNMSYSLSAAEDDEEWFSRGKKTQAAFLSLGEKPYKDTAEIHRPVYPLEDLIMDYHWIPAYDEEVKNVSAISVQTGVLLAEEKGIPVGVVHTAMGGLGAEAYMTRESVENDLELKNFLQSVGRYHSVEDYNNAGARNYSQLAGLWNEKIAPLIGMKFKGLIWYLGESSAWDFTFAQVFVKQMQYIVKDLKKAFGNLPFIAISIAPEYYPYGDTYGYEYINEALLQLQQQESNVLTLPIYDIEPRWLKTDGATYYHPIHPTNKAPISQRVANALLGKREKYPEITSVEYKEGKAICRVSNLLEGLCEGEIFGFTIAENSGKYYPAYAKTVGKDKIEVYSPDVKKPAKLTYAFMQYQEFCNAKDKDGAPLQMYRSRLESVNEEYCFPPAYTANGKLEVYEGNFGWQAGTCHKMPVWKKGEIYNASEVNISAKEDCIYLQSKPTVENYSLFGISPAICLCGHKNHFSDYKYLNFQLKADGEVEFLGMLVRESNGNIFRLHLLNGEANVESMPVEKQFITFTCSLEQGLRGDSAPVEFDKMQRKNFVQAELLFRAREEVCVSIKNVTLSDINLSKQKKLEKKEEEQRADAQLIVN